MWARCSYVGEVVVHPSPSGEGLGEGLNNHAAPLMGRAYLNVRATGRSGYIPSMWRGVGWRGSFGTFLQRKVVKRFILRAEERKNPALEPPLSRGSKGSFFSVDTEKKNINHS